MGQSCVRGSSGAAGHGATGDRPLVEESGVATRAAAAAAAAAAATASTGPSYELQGTRGPQTKDPNLLSSRIFRFDSALILANAAVYLHRF